MPWALVVLWRNTFQLMDYGAVRHVPASCRIRLFGGAERNDAAVIRECSRRGDFSGWTAEHYSRGSTP